MRSVLNGIDPNKRTRRAYRYNDKGYRESYIVKDMKIKANEKYGELVKFYKFNDNYSWNNAKEIDSQINANPEYCKIMRSINEQEYFLTFITETLEDFKNLGYNIKNYLDYKKLMMGS